MLVGLWLAVAYFLTFCHSDILLPPSTFKGPYDYPGASQVALVVKNLLASAGVLRDVGSIPELGRSPGRGMATHSNILAWRIPWTEEPGGLQSIGSQRVRHDWSDLSQNSTAQVRETKNLRYSTMYWKTKERPLITNGELSESSKKRFA